MIFIIGLLCIAGPAGADITPAGTTIQSQSWAEYYIGPSYFQSYSPTIETQVSAVYDLSLLPIGTVPDPAYTLIGTGGDTLYCAFTVTNLSNCPDSMEVGYQLVPPSDANIENLILFNDRNVNGRYDAGEEDPAYLSLDLGGSTGMNAAVVLPTGTSGGDSYLNIYALSTTDSVPVARSTIIRVRNLNDDSAPFSLGPYGNPRALPGGEGSGDDLTVGTVDRLATTYVFQNDLLNENDQADVIQLCLSDSTQIPAGLTVSILDSLGGSTPLTSAREQAVPLGLIQPGEQRTISVQVTGDNGPICSVLTRPLALELVAQSLLDTVMTNRTVDRLVPVQQINPAATITLSQTFKENKAATGDVVTMVVSVRNISDSLRVDSLVVSESVQPALNFMQSTGFVPVDRVIHWDVGSLDSGEEKQMAVKFLVNSRVTRGWTKVIGKARARAETGDPVWAGPAISALRIENDLFADEGLILGDVFVDENGNSRRDPGEPGVPGAVVFVESGAYALSDSGGKFSLPRTFAGYRIVRLDESSLPGGLQAGPPAPPEPAVTDGFADGRPAASTERPDQQPPHQRLVHLLPGGHAMVQFPVYRIPEPPPVVTTVAREITCQEKVSIRKQYRTLYESISIPSSLFPSGKAYLREGVIDALEPVPAFLLSHPGWRVLLEGYTDNVPVQNTENFKNNIGLSLERARAVKRYLIANGVAEGRIVARGHGEANPIADNSTEAGRSMNRRVELSFIPIGVSEYDAASINRVKAEMRNIDDLPDSVQVKIFWELVTDTPESRDGYLEIFMPEQCADPIVKIEKDGAPIVPSGGRYPVKSFKRSSGIYCEISFFTPTADTAVIRDVTAVLGLPPAAGQREMGSDIQVIRPLENGPSDRRTVVASLASWREEIQPADEPPAESPPVKGQATQTGGSAEPPAAVPPARTGGPCPAVTGDAGFGIVAPEDETVFTRSNQIRICTQVPLGSRYELFSGNQAVPTTQIGEKEIYLEQKLEQITWYGVEIKPGRNTLRLNGRMIDGGLFEDSVHVVLATAPRRLRAMRQRVLIPADGRTGGIIRFAVTDALDYPVADGFVATVTAGDLLLSNADARPGTRGLQLASQDGYFVAQVKPDRQTGRRTLRVEMEDLQAVCEVAFVPPQRTAFVSGIAEANLGIFNKTGQGSPLGLNDFYDGVKLKGDSRLFLQGTGYGGLNLTARLDSRRQHEDPFMPAIEPDEGNAIYGDASEQRFAAPARDGNYVALEKDESYLKYGDFKTPMDGGEYLRYQRSATGLSGAISRDNDSFKAFLTRTDFATRRDELPGDGTSGYYYLSRSPVVEHTEKITLETRDRYQPEKILDVRPLARNRDYTINYYDGAILFKSPVPVTDDRFNPVVVVVVYESRTADEANYVYGLRGDLASGRTGRVGATAVARSGDGQRYVLYGIDGSISMSGLSLSGELARSDDEMSGDGNAFKLEAAYRNRYTESSVYYRNVDGDFLNPSFTGGAHELATRKYGYESNLKVSPGLTLESKGYSHRLDRTGEKKEALESRAEFGLGSARLTAGLLGARHHKLEDRRKGLLALAGARAGTPEGPSVAFRLDKNLQRQSVEDYPDRMKSELGIPFLERYKFLANYEYRTASGQSGTHQGSGGVRSRWGEDGAVYSKYRMDRTASEERAGAVTGLKQKVNLRENLDGSFDIENYHSLSGGQDRDYFALKTGLGTIKQKSHVLEGQYEYRWEHTRRKHLLRLNALAEMRGGMSVLLKNALAFCGADQQRDALSYNGRLAAAYRPVVSPVTALGYIKTGYERYTPVDPEAVTWKLIMSFDLNIIPAAGHELRFKLAQKRMENASHGLSVTSWSRLLLSQYIHYFLEHWDVDVWGRLLTQQSGGTRELGGGVEVGRMFHRFIRVSAGYSINGFEERDLAENDAWARGFDIRVQFILSDWLLREMGL